ncbi:hypothetical protein [Anaerolentibacter hominis]
MREIASRYHGTVQFEQKDGMFYASVLLKTMTDGAEKCRNEIDQ